MAQRLDEDIEQRVLSPAMLSVGHPGGLCNRLDVITTGYLLARQRGDEGIEVFWPVNETDMPVTFERLFTHLPRGRVVDSTIDDRVSHDYYAAAASLPANYRDCLSYRETLRGVLDNVVPEVQSEVSNFVEAHFWHKPERDELTVGIHVRRTERPWPLCEFAQPLRYYEAMMKSFPKTTRFFISTDSQEAFCWLQSRFGDRIFQQLKAHDNRSSLAGVREGLVDFLLLSRCDAIVGTGRSSFSHLAGLAGDCPLVRLTAFPQIPSDWPHFSRWRWVWSYRHFLVEPTFWKRWLFYVVRPQVQRLWKIPGRCLRPVRDFVPKSPRRRSAANLDRT